MKTQKNFPANLFDFDFQAEEAAAAFRREKCAEIDAEERDERLTLLRKLSRRALEEDRMGAYFRLLDSIDEIESCACEPTVCQKSCTIPEVRLRYVGKKGTAAAVRGSEDSVKIFRESYDDGEIEMQEFFKVLYLSRSNKPLGIHTVGMGGIEGVLVDKKIVFAGALLAHASGIIVCHNHPSGNLRPSIPDDDLTRKLREGAKILDIKFLDHIILTSDGYYSYNDEGKL